MTKKTELVSFDFAGLPSVDLMSDSDLKDLERGSDFLQRIQLYSKGKPVDTKMIPAGHYGVPQPGGEEIADLGEEIDILPFCVKPKAMDMSDKSNIIVNYDRASDEFQRIEARAAVQNSHCIWGFTFLVLERSTGRFYEYFANNKSARNEAAKLVPFLPVSKEKAARVGIDPHGPLPCTLKTRYAENKSEGWGWYAPVAVECSEPFTDMPAVETVQREVKRFVETKSSDAEGVTEEEVKTTSKRKR